MRISHVELRSNRALACQYVSDSQHHDADLARLYHTTRLVDRGVERNAMSKVLAKAVMAGKITFQTEA